MLPDPTAHGPLRSAALHVLLSILAVGLAACSSGSGSGGLTPSPPTVTPPTPSATQQLNPGKLIKGIDGVAVGAPAGTLATPVSVTIESTALPAVALPFGTELIGSAYRVSAAEFRNAAADTQFVIGFPLPPGRNPATLSIALLLNGDSAAASEPPAGSGSPADVWTLLPAYHETGSGLLFAPAAAVMPDGVIYALVSTPVTLTQTVAAGDNTREGRSEQRRTIASHSTASELVLAKCSLDFMAPGVSAACQLDQLEWVEDMAAGYIGQLFAAGFDPPHLLRWVNLVRLADDSIVQELGPYMIEIVPCALNNSSYEFVAARLKVCQPEPSGITSYPSSRALRHLLFLSAESAYPAIFRAVLEDSKRHKWFTDSAASAATWSDTMQLRRRVDLAPKDPIHSLLDHESGFRAQDFWVFLDTRGGSQGLSLFPPLLKAGPRPADIDAALLANSGRGLGEFFFDWAKNQAYENEVMLPEWGTIDPESDPSVIRSQCRGTSVTTAGANYHLGFTGGLPTASGNWISHDIEGLYLDGNWGWPSAKAEIAGTRVALDVGHAAPLTARMYVVELSGNRGPYAARISVDPGSASVAYKVYDQTNDFENYVEGGPHDCAEFPDNTPRVFQVPNSPQDRERTAVVLIVEKAYAPDTGPLPVPPPKIVIEQVGLHLDPTSATFELEPGVVEANSFTIFNDSSEPISLMALEDVDWLNILPGDDTGVIPAHGSKVVSYEARCANPDGRAATDIALLFNTSAGAPLTGPSVPSAFHIEQSCREPQPACIDEARYDGYHATATLSWTGNGSRQSDLANYSASILHNASVETTWQFSTRSISSNGTGFVSDRSTRESGGIVSVTEWSGRGEGFNGPPGPGRAPPAVAASYNPGNCTWAVEMQTVYVDGERNSNGSKVEVTLNVGRAVVNGVLANGTAQIPLWCTVYNDGPECSIGTAAIGNQDVFLNASGLTVDDPNVPRVSFGWSVTPILRP